MSDEQITISVDDAAVDEAIAKLDEALAKTSQLTGQTPEATQLGKTEQITGQPGETTGFYTIPNAEMDQVAAKQNADFYTIPNSEMDEIRARAAEAQANVGDAVVESTRRLTDLEGETEQAKINVAIAVSDSKQKLEELKVDVEPSEVDTSDATVKLDDLEAKTAEAKANVDDVVSESEQKLDALKNDADATITETDDMVASEGGEIKGLDSASSRVIRMIPGLREAQRIQRSIGLLSEGSIMGGLGLLLVAYSIYKQISSMLEQQQQQRDELQKAIMEIRGFTTSAQFLAWQEGQRQLIEGYRSGIIP